MSETPKTPESQTPDLGEAQAQVEALAVAAHEGESPPAEAPDDADDLRGYHFKQLLRQTSTWVILGIVILIAGAAAGIYFKNAPAGGGAALAVFLLGILAVFLLADSRAEDAFFVHYAKANGLQLGGRTSLPEATPLLGKGDDRYAERTLTGDLGPGVNGVLALYTYEEERTDSNGNRETDYYRYTVGLVQIPECAGFIPELYVQRKFGLKALEKFEDAFRGKKTRVKFESAELDKRFEIFVHENQDQNWLRQLFSPSFIVWMLQKTPDRFAFELKDGTLCCYANNHKKKSADLDRMRAATCAVATRIREEALE